MNTLLSREEFKKQVFARSKGCCVFCGKPAVDAHHILERKLYPDGGYYLNNGAAVCEDHHWQCERTDISVQEVWKACSIIEPVYPPGFFSGLVYDKWGNIVDSDGYITPGPLFQDVGCQKMLKHKLYLIRVFYENSTCS